MKLDPVNVGAGIAISLSDTRMTSTGAGNARGLTGKSSGIWYAEVQTVSDISQYAMFGICLSSATTTGYPGSAADSWGYWNQSGNKFNAGSGASYGASYSSSNRMGVKLDMGAGSITFYKDGVSQGVAFSGLAPGTYQLMLGNGGGGSNLVMDLKTTLLYLPAGATQWDDT